MLVDSDFHGLFYSAEQDGGQFRHSVGRKDGKHEACQKIALSSRNLGEKSWSILFLKKMSDFKKKVYLYFEEGCN